MTVLGLYARRWDPYSGDRFIPVTADACWSCGRPRPDLAHAVMEHVIGVVAGELERRVAAAVTEHQAEHGCGDNWHWTNGCDVAGELLDLLPDGLLPVAFG